MISALSQGATKYNLCKGMQCFWKTKGFARNTIERKSACQRAFGPQDKKTYPFHCKKGPPMVGALWAGWVNGRRQMPTGLRQLSKTSPDGLFRNPQDFWDGPGCFLDATHFKLNVEGQFGGKVNHEQVLMKMVLQIFHWISSRTITSGSTHPEKSRAPSG